MEVILRDKEQKLNLSSFEHEELHLVDNCSLKISSSSPEIETH